LNREDSAILLKDLNEAKVLGYEAKRSLISPYFVDLLPT